MKVNQATAFGEVFNLYASRSGVSVSALNFLLDGERINPDHTPRDLDLRDNEQIDAIPHVSAC
ncbi:unnamed protein product [Heterosigma akashiwo]